MSTKTVTIRQSCVAPSLVHASCWQAQVGHPETTGHRPSHAGWGPVGVECHLGFCQILAGRFPCNGYEHIQIYTTATKNGVVFCMMCNQTAFSIQKNNHRSFHTHGTGTLTAIPSSGGVVDDLFKIHAENTMMAGWNPPWKIHPNLPSLVAVTRRWCLAYSRPRVASSDFLLCPQLAGGHWFSIFFKISKLCHLRGV